MTTTLIFWIKLCLIAVIVWTVAKHFRTWIKDRKSGKKFVLKKSDLISDIIFIAFGIFILYHIQTNYQKTFNSVLSSSTATFPSFGFTDLSSNTDKKLEDFHSRLILVNYWATWCGPCRREMPALNEVYAEFNRNDLEIIAISDEDVSVINNYIKDKNFRFVTARLNRSNDLLDSIGQRPVSILLNEEHKVIDMIVGSRGHRFFKNWIDENLKKSRIDGSK